MVATNISTPTLQIGAKGSTVKDLREILVFQDRYFLESDGIVGPSTWRVLLKGGTQHLPVLRRGDRGALVERLQRAMRLGSKTGPANEIQSIIGTRGYYFGAIDGDFGPATEQAVKAFQQKPPFGRSLSPIDGIVGPQTWDVLLSLVARVSHHFL